MSQILGERAGKPVRVVRLIPATEAGAAASSPPRTELATPKAPFRGGSASATLRQSIAPIIVSYPRPVPRWVFWSLWWLAGLAVCCAWDRAVWLGVSSAGKPKLEWLEHMGSLKGYWAVLGQAASFKLAALRDLVIATAYMVVYGFGRIYFWALLAAVIIFRGWMGTDVQRLRLGLRRGVFIVAVPALAGIGAELLKFAARRGRPEVADGHYQFMPYPEVHLRAPIESIGRILQNIGFASSHVALSIAAALAVGLVYPKARPIVWPLALLCSLSRVLVGAHFLSDAYAGVTVAVLVYLGFRALDLRNNRGVPINRPLAA